MSVNPQMMAQLLQQGGQGQTPQMSPMGGAANLLQQILAMQQLKQRMAGGQDPNQQPPMPQTTMGAPGAPGQAQPQGMNQNPMFPGIPS